MVTKYRYIGILLFIGFMGFFIACERGHDPYELANPDELVSITLGLSVDGLVEPMTRSDDENILDLTGERYKESGISESNMVVFFFDEQGDYVYHVENGFTFLGGRSIEYWSLSNRLKLTIPAEDILKLYNKGTLRIVVIANSTFTLWSKIRKYDDLMLAEEYTDFNGEVQPSYFLMDGSVYVDSSIFEPGKRTISIGKTVEMIRAAAKIRVIVDDVLFFDLNKFSAYGTIKASFVNFSKMGTLVKSFFPKPIQILHSIYDVEMEGLVEKYEGYELGEPVVEGTSLGKFGYETTIEPFYSYEVDWTSTLIDKSKKQPYILLSLPIRETKTGKIINYYYKVPIAGQATKIERNHYYFIRVHITKAGSLDPGDAVELKPKLSIKPNWKESLYLSDSKDSDVDFFDIDQADLTVYDDGPHELNYKTNIANLEVISEVESVTSYTYTTILSTEISGIKLDGESAERKLGISLEDKGTHIELISKLKGNYEYREINLKFKVQGRTGMEQRLTIYQYPSILLSFQESRGLTVNHGFDFRYQDGLGLKPENDYQKLLEKTNKRLTRVRVLSNNATPYMHLGDPTVVVDGKRVTDSSEAGNNTVSPDFIVSSDRGEGFATYQKSPNSKASGWYSPRLFDSMVNYPSKDIFTIGSPTGLKYPSSPRYFGGQHYPVGEFPQDNTEHVPDDSKYLARANQTIYTPPYSAVDRCYYYFEDDYGPEQIIEEHYINANGRLVSQKVKVSPKYKGRWRLPTAAEMSVLKQLKINRRNKSILENFLPEPEYWVALSDHYFSVRWTGLTQASKSEPYHVRCVFDVWKAKK